MHIFPEDFYNETLKIVLLGEIRKMTTFKDTSMSMKLKYQIIFFSIKMN